MYFTPLADVTSMPKHFGKTIKVYHYVPLLDDRNVNDQGLDASGATIANGNLYGSSRDIGTITSRMPLLAKSQRQIEQELRDSQTAEHLALVRCRVYNLNPAKADLPGEIISVANRFIGTVRKFIPFGEATENGYHIPRVLVEDLKSRQFQPTVNSEARRV